MQETVDTGTFPWTQCESEELGGGLDLRPGLTFGLFGAGAFPHNHNDDDDDDDDGDGSDEAADDTCVVCTCGEREEGDE